mmetsp:Transcript_11062/g.12658  ORF Transcript_11062/g.12658 Transcript_11062/m.12658 type:complete len:207 (-) Transcript_11062:1304-1924(-)
MSRKVGSGSKRPLSRYDTSSKSKAGSTEEQLENDLNAKKGSIKNQIRSIRRLIKKGFLTGKALESKERDLKRLERLVEKNKKNERDRALAKKYHKIKFFERVKLTRRIKRIEKELAEAKDPASIEEIKSRKSELEKDLQYVLHFPKGYKYISLFSDDLRPEQMEERNRLREMAGKEATKHKKKLKSLQTEDNVKEQKDAEADDFFL